MYYLQVFKFKDGKYYLRLIGKSKKVLMVSKGYNSREGCLQLARRLQSLMNVPVFIRNGTNRVIK